MKEIDMHYTFIKCAKRFISDIDKEELDWQLRTHQCYFDDSGPCCSDATLLAVFRDATFNKVDESKLYAVIEKICMCYCNEIESARSLTSIIIPEGTTAIEPYAFRGFAALASITIPKSVTEIGEAAFLRSGLTSVVIPGGVGEIKRGTFSDCTGLTSVVIPEGVTTIDYGAFFGCTSLTSVEIPKGVKKIGDSFGSALQTITLPAGVAKIDYWAFYNCKSLKTIYVPAKKTDYYKKRLPEELHQFIVEMEPVKKVKKK